MADSCKIYTSCWVSGSGSGSGADTKDPPLNDLGQAGRHSSRRTITPIYNMYVALFRLHRRRGLVSFGQAASFLSWKMKQVMILVVLITLHTMADQPLLAHLGISI